ncbi:hypothetical protein GCM10009544_63010 [Streptomyces stramineus]|uniref:Uncharacterized protein n=1 Tax=Streptomyces stramineus TaxID=173861 RepID=A0ABN1BBD7_9ACTN
MTGCLPRFVQKNESSVLKGDGPVAEEGSAVRRESLIDMPLAYAKGRNSLMVAKTAASWKAAIQRMISTPSGPRQRVRRA